MKLIFPIITALLLAPLPALQAADAFEHLSPHKRVIFAAQSIGSTTTSQVWV